MSMEYSSAGYTIEFIGDPCGRHGSYTFFRAFKFCSATAGISNGTTASPTAGTAPATWRRLQLGKFFHAQVETFEEELETQSALRSRSCGTTQLRPFKGLQNKRCARKGECRKTPLIGELQLIWEDRNREGEKLASVRFYITPENCPLGRQSYHGENEILAQEEKLVVRLSQLVLMVTDDDNSIMTSSPMMSDDAGEDRLNDSGNLPRSQSSLRILSYPQYCRYRAHLKKLESAGGNSAETNPCQQTKIYFCRETISLSQLQNFEHKLNHLAPSLKGRKRKKKCATNGTSGNPGSNGNKMTESEDSNESESIFDSANKNREPALINAAEPDEKDLEIACKKLKLSNGEDGDCKLAAKNSANFLKKLQKFMCGLNQPISKSPVIGFKEVDLYKFFMVTKNLGGYNQVTEKRLWKVVYDQLGGSTGNTSAATGTRKIYEKLLLPFEQSKSSRRMKRSRQLQQQQQSQQQQSKVESTIIKIELHDDQKATTKTTTMTSSQNKDGGGLIINNKERAAEVTAEKVDGQQIKVEIAESSPSFECKVSIKKLDQGVDTKRDNKVKNLQRKLERLERRVKKCVRFNPAISAKLEQMKKEEPVVDLTVAEDATKLLLPTIKKENDKLDAVPTQQQHQQRQDNSYMSSSVSLSQLRPILPSNKRPSSANDIKLTETNMRSVICKNNSHRPHPEESMPSQTTFSRSAIFAALSSAMSPRATRHPPPPVPYPALRSACNVAAPTFDCTFSSPLKQFIDKTTTTLRNPFYHAADQPLDLSMKTLMMQKMPRGFMTDADVDQPLDLSNKSSRGPHDHQTGPTLITEVIDLCVSNWSRGNSSEPASALSNLSMREPFSQTRISLPSISIGMGTTFIHPSLIPNVTVLSQALRPAASPSILLNSATLPFTPFSVMQAYPVNNPGALSKRVV